MERIPNTPDALVQTLDRLRHALELLAAGVAQQRRLLQDLVRLHVAHADGLFLAVDVTAAQHRVPARPRRHGHFDLRVGAREGCEVGFEEGAGSGGFALGSCRTIGGADRVIFEGGLDVLHSFTAASPVAVVEVHALALEDEGANAVLVVLSVQDRGWRCVNNSLVALPLSVALAGAFLCLAVTTRRP